MPDRDNSPPVPSPGATERRRSSFSASALADLFTRPSVGGGGGANAGMSNSPPTYPGPITTAAAQAQRRRLSLTTLGLSGSPNQASPFNTARPRGESLSSATSGSVDESPFEDDGPTSSASVPSTPFGRRLSFGARALRDVRTGSGSAANANGRPSIAKSSSPPTTKSRGEGFNIAENLRSRAERSSVSGPSMSPSQTQPHLRTKSMAAMERPIREAPSVQKAPDAFQERILKGDFYMD